MWDRVTVGWSGRWSRISLSSGSLGAETRMLEMSHQLVSRGDYIPNVDHSSLVRTLWRNNLSLSEGAKRPGWL